MAKKVTKTKTEKKIAVSKLVFNLVLWTIGLTAIILVLCWSGGNSPWESGNGWDAIGNWFKRKETAAGFATLFVAIIIIVALCSLLRLASNGIAKIKNKKAATTFSIVSSLIKWFSIFFAGFCVLRAWGAKEQDIFVSAGILALVIGLGCQTLISDVIAGIFLVTDNAFEVGDIVVIDDFRGTVTEIGVKSTKVIDAGGNVKVVANSHISSLINLTDALSIAAITVSIPYEENIKRTETLLIQHLEEMKKNIPAIVEGPYYKGVEALGDSAVIIKIIAKVKEDDRFQAVRDMNRDMFIFMNENNIVIPYPQVTITNGPNPADHPEWVDKEKLEKKAEKELVKQQEEAKDIEQDNIR